jgi:hypothetical protein
MTRDHSTPLAPPPPDYSNPNPFPFSFYLLFSSSLSLPIHSSFHCLHNLSFSFLSGLYYYSISNPFLISSFLIIPLLLLNPAKVYTFSLNIPLLFYYYPIAIILYLSLYIYSTPIPGRGK